MIVDSTVQEKAIAHPTDSRLLEVARDKIARLAKRAGIKLKLTHEREGRTLRRKAAGYAHAKQFRRLHKTIKRQRTILGRLLREVRRKMGELPERRAGSAGHLADACRAAAPPAAEGQEQAVCAARARGRVHLEGQGPQPVRVRREGQPGGDAQTRADGRRAEASPATRTTGIRWPPNSSRRTRCCRTSASCR